MSQGRVTVAVGRVRALENAAGTESTGAPALYARSPGRKQWTATQRASATAPSMSWPMRRLPLATSSESGPKLN